MQKISLGIFLYVILGIKVMIIQTQFALEEYFPVNLSC